MIRHLGFGTVSCLAFSFALFADQQENLRAFVKEAISNPQIFVVNPPAELRAYADLSPEEIQRRQENIMMNGSLLYLYPNGMPGKLESNKGFQPHGPKRAWYADGTLQTDEIFENGTLITGRYFSGDGKLLAEIQNGKGQRIEFDLMDRGKNPVIRSIAEYSDGVKNGRETSYFDHAAGRIASETEYLKGQKEGEEKHWTLSGQLNSRGFYSEGKQDGDFTYWHENGRVKELVTYRQGQWIGNRSRYEENGQKVEENIYDEKMPFQEYRWYPEGSMMVHKKYDPSTNRLAEATSFDRAGAVNGIVRDGSGILVLRDPNIINPTSDRFYLEIHQKGEHPSQKPLPILRWRSVGEKDATMTLGLSAGQDPEFDELECLIRLPESEAEPLKVHFSSGQDTVIPTQIPLPSLAAQWTGTIFGQTTVRGEVGTFQFTQIVYSKTPKRV